MTFKQWLISELENNPNVDGDLSTTTRDRNALKAAVHTTIQNPKVGSLVTKASSNRSAALKSAINLAQKTLNRHPGIASGANPAAVTAVDVAKGVMGRVSRPSSGITKSF